MKLTKSERAIIQRKVYKWKLPAHRVAVNGEVSDKQGKLVGTVKSVVWKRWWGPKVSWLADVEFIHFQVGDHGPETV